MRVRPVARSLYCNYYCKLQGALQPRRAANAKHDAVVLKSARTPRASIQGGCRQSKAPVLVVYCERATGRTLMVYGKAVKCRRRGSGAARLNPRRRRRESDGVGGAKEL